MSQAVPRGWHERGYLPHFDPGAVHQTVTFRLADSLPAHVPAGWLAELERLPEDQRDPELRRRIDAYIDRGIGECWLGRPEIGGMVESALLHFHAARYDLLAWVVVPNHVHVLFQPAEGWTVSGILHAWKSYTANVANRILNRTGLFWHPDYFDRFVRDEDHFRRAWEYIEVNPVKTGLCIRPEDWPFGSARRRIEAAT
jgi:REP element-mobilizing transposase RayT